MSINRNLAKFAPSINTSGKAAVATITVTVSGGKYYIDGTQQQTMSLAKGITYRLDNSDSTNSGHPLVFSTESNGGGSSFSTGITTVGTAGSTGAYIEVTLEQDAPDHLGYYCSNHSGMGGLVKTAPIGDANFASFGSTFTFPTSDGSANQVLQTDGSGTLSFGTPASSYGNSDVDSHLNQSNPTSGHVLSWNGSDYAWVSNAGYTDSDVDTHLNRSSASTNQILSWNGSDYAWVDDQSGSGGIASVLADTTPQLGGDLDVNGQSIVSASNGNIAITPNGTGKIVLDGLSFPTADGSANQVLKTDGSGQLSFVDQSTGGGGGSLTATAAGTLANGDMVILNADGTVSKIGTQSVSAATGSETTFSSSSTSYPNAVYDSNAGKVVVCYEDSGDSAKGKAVVGTLSGTSITFGTPVEFASSVEFVNMVYDENAQKVVISYQDEGNDYCSAIVGTVSGNSISFGAETNFGNECYQTRIAYDASAQKVVVIYRRKSDSHGYAAVGTIDTSDNSISFGSSTAFISGYTGYFAVGYDKGAQKTVVAYQDYDGSGRQGYVKVATISGTSISFGTGVSLGNSCSNFSLGYDDDAAKLVVFYLRAFTTRGRTITISGTTPSLGTEADTGIWESGSRGADVEYDTNAQKLVFVAYDNGSSYLEYVLGTISGTDITFSSVTVLASHSASHPSIAYVDGSLVVVYTDTANSSTGDYTVFNNAYSITRALTAENFIGVSDAAYSDGATATIQVTGAVDDAQSSLTPAQTYFVQSDGSIGLTPSSPSVVAGTAVSATELLIKSGQPVERPNTTTMVASGALANGDKVIVNSNGTVSTVGATTTSQSASIGSTVQWYDGTVNEVTALYDPDNSKVIVAYKKSNPSACQVVVGEVSGTSISFGSAVTFYNDNANHISMVYDTANNKVVIVYVNDDTYGAAIVGTVSGSSVSFGSETIWLSSRADDVEAVYDSAAGAVVIAFMDFDNSYHCKAIAATVSGTSLTFGSAITINAANSAYIRIGYDSTNSKSVVAFRQSGGKAAVVSCSGTTLSAGSVTTFNSNNGSYPMDVVHDPNAGKTVIFYHDQQNSYYGYGVVGTVSGTGVSFGTPVQLDTARSNRISGVYDDDAQKILVAYTDHASSNSGAYRLATVSGTSISFGSEASFYDSYEVQTGYTTIGAVFDSTNNVVVLAFRGRDSSNAQDGYARVIQNAATISASNLTATNFIGISDAAYSDGATATIQIAGSVDDAQSSLTAGQLYYVQTDGTLSTTAGSPSVIAGTAISATKIIVKG